MRGNVRAVRATFLTIVAFGATTLLTPTLLHAADADDRAARLTAAAPECSARLDATTGLLTSDPQPVGADQDRRDAQRADGTVLLTPPRFDLSHAELRAGDVFTCVLEVRSRLAATATFDVETRGVLGSNAAALDIRYVSRGQSDAARTAVSWLTPAAPQIVVEPGATTLLPVTVRVPRGPASGARYAVVDLVSRTRAGGEQSVGVETAVESAFLFDVGEAGQPHLQLTKLDAPSVRFNRARWTLHARLSNAGSLHATPRGRVRVRSIFGSTVATPSVDVATLLPGAARRIDADWSRVPWFGLYRWDLRIDDGTGATTTRTGWLLVLPPPWVLAAIAIMLAVILSGFLRRRLPYHDWDDGDEWDEEIIAE